jgi:hypothetical protein
MRAPVAMTNAGLRGPMVAESGTSRQASASLESVRVTAMAAPPVVGQASVHRLGSELLGRRRRGGDNCGGKELGRSPFKSRELREWLSRFVETLRYAAARAPEQTSLEARGATVSLELDRLGKLHEKGRSCAWSPSIRRPPNAAGPKGSSGIVC